MLTESSNAALGNPASRTCFVIMPFSNTDSCTEDEWTEIFEQVIRPAVEAADYECRRSTPTRGSLIRSIMQDLDASYVVLADLTDRNPNVFYELGVRHALKNRTILIAQKLDDIPFDLRSYACHVYKWREEDDREAFTRRVAALLADVDSDPNRADNPVSDFLHSIPSRQHSVPSPASLEDLEARVAGIETALRLLGGRSTAGKEGALEVLRDSSALAEGEPPASWLSAGVEVAKARDGVTLRRVAGRMVRDLRSALPEKIQDLNSPMEGTIARDKIASKATEYEQAFAPLTKNIELFALGLASEDWPDGARAVLQIAAELISHSEGISGLRFAGGLPAFFGWRLILLSGARSLQEESLSITKAVINDPIALVELGGQTTLRPLFRRHDLFYPDALLGYADLGILQIGSSCHRAEHILQTFGTEDDFQVSLAGFLMLVALRDAMGEDRPLFPGYRLLPNSQRAADVLKTRLATDPSYLARIAEVFGMTSEELHTRWADLATRANAAPLGHHYFAAPAVIPTTLAPT